MTCPVLHHVQRALASYPQDHPWIIGVSGGRDSVCLLRAIHELGYKNVLVAHVDHQLRGSESTADAQWVQQLAAGLGYPFHLHQAPVRELAAQRQQSLETVGRDVRMALWSELAQAQQRSGILLAHHAEDQAETVLMHLLRGAGLRGAAAMQPHTEHGNYTLLRPLLAVRRAEIIHYLQRHDQPYREDSSNASLEPTRNRLRLEALPLLSQCMGRDVVPQLLRFSQLAAREDSHLHAEAEDLLHSSQQDEALLLTPQLLTTTPALQHRVLELWLRHCGVSGISQDLVSSTAALLSKGQPARVNLPQGLQVRRKGGLLRITPQQKR
jgi:tRNA(Ile)-lysidine synthase